MKYLISLLLIFSSFTLQAKAQTPVTNEQAQKYYESCATNRDERMDIKTQDVFCQCSSMGYKKHMTQEDLQYLAVGEGQEARDVMNKMVLKLYAPCMEFPVRDMVYKKCTKDAYQAGQYICSCMADKMASYISERAQAELSNILKENPNVYDPLEAITSSETYARQEKRIVLQCIQGKQ